MHGGWRRRRGPGAPGEPQSCAPRRPGSTPPRGLRPRGRSAATHRATPRRTCGERALTCRAPASGSRPDVRSRALPDFRRRRPSRAARAGLGPGAELAVSLLSSSCAVSSPHPTPPRDMAPRGPFRAPSPSPLVTWPRVTARLAGGLRRAEAGRGVSVRRYRRRGDGSGRPRPAAGGPPEAGAPRQLRRVAGRGPRAPLPRGGRVLPVTSVCTQAQRKFRAHIPRTCDP